MPSEKHDLELREWVCAATEGHVLSFDTPEDELQWWLDRATDGLCDIAKRRVEAEIRAHYAEAVAAGTAEGLNEDDAHDAAMTALGDETEAREAFFKTYLTEREAEGLEVEGFASFRNMSVWLQVSVTLAFLLFVFLIVKVVHNSPVERGFPFDILIFASSLLVGSFILFGLSPRLARQRQWRRVLIWRATAWLLFLVVVVFFCFLRVADGESYLHAVASQFLQFLIPLVWILRDAVTLRKLRKHTDLYDSLADKHNGGWYA